jgi:hypothetical protein
MPPTSRTADYRKTVAAGAGAVVLAAVAAGAFDLPGIITAFTPARVVYGAALFLSDQLRWGAGAAAACLALVAAGVFRKPWRERLADALAAIPPGRWLAALAAVALALRLAYAFTAAPPFVSDEACYDRVTRSLLAGGGYAEGGVPTAYWPIGYPLFIAPLYVLGRFHPFVVILAQAVLGAGTAVLVTALAEAAAFDRAAARAAGLAVAVLPSQIGYASRIFPQVLCAFLVVLAAFIVIRYGRWWAGGVAGAILGYATLVVPVAATLGVAVFVTDVLCGRPWRRVIARALCAAAVATAVIMPWAVRNYRVLGAFVPFATNGGANLWMGNNPRASGAYRFPLTMENPVYIAGGEVAQDRTGRRLALRFMTEERDRALLLMVPKFLYLYGSDVSAFQYEGEARGESPLAAARGWKARLAQLMYAAFVVAGVIGLGRRKGFFRPGPAGVAPAAVFIWPALLTVAYLFFFGGERFHFPMVPFLAVFAGAALMPPGRDAVKSGRESERVSGEEGGAPVLKGRKDV